MWGYRIVIPEKFKIQLLTELHSTHMGMSKMKNLARGYFWWPNLDDEIENFCKSCNVCMTNSINPKKCEVINWPETKEAFDRNHADFLGPSKGKQYLIVTDSFSKWPEVYEMAKLDSETTIEKLRDIFARFGIPKLLVSDNGRQFVSQEFVNFCAVNKIKHVTSAPLHPATNGAAENAVKTFKYSLYKLLSDDKHKGCSLNTLINRFLFSYRNTPHWITNESPSYRMFNRKVRSRFDYLKETTLDCKPSRRPSGREVYFDVGEIVYATDYRNANRRVWQKCRVEEVLGCRNYIVKLETEDLIWRRHADQMIKTCEFNSGLEQGQVMNSDFEELYTKNELYKEPFYGSIEPYSSPIDCETNAKVMNPIESESGRILLKPVDAKGK
ncbi:uncharacterized protein K02A2.6-like [Ischnura elegans]|uniref:uncharacterized protein K02A2.6-like n=1 Tax=Ischnura elegans TaxID=197161 RepID=UPI001ED890AE|nr:uncharacterized protein K02A2.6-like [Ischnura elegans]XP_046387451.1 uncharacterized protein K02A2.6-like [Ischnura elegans]